MNQITSRLVNILNVELEAYGKLLAILNEEQDTLIHWRIGDLQDVVEKKDRQLEQVTRLEKKRMDFLESIHQDLQNMGLASANDEGTVQLTDIITMVTPEEKITLRELHEDLSIMVKEVTTTNYKNQVLLKRSLEIVNANLNIYAQSEKLANTYNTAGNINASIERHLIDGTI